MPEEKILIIDDEPDLVQIVKINLELAGYIVKDADNGEDGVRLVKEQRPDVVLLDVMLPDISGNEVCKILKNDPRTCFIPIMMLTARSQVTDKVKGLHSGADDYLTKPFEPEELIARIEMLIRRSKRDLGANPLTGLPGAAFIEERIKKVVEQGTTFAVYYLDCDNFKAFNDKYGYQAGNELLKAFANIIVDSVDKNVDFVGHIGGDDFIIITEPLKIDAVCTKIIKDFDRIMPTFYDEVDLKKGYIQALDRQGNTLKFPIITLSIAVVTNTNFIISNHLQIGEIAAELKKKLKKELKSNYLVNRRTKLNP
ncbi:MAG: response regulator [Candidatus Hydrogenedentota bacterium]